ncbi:cytochrome c oxidase assembly protein [Devosia sp. YR412]|uniref:cytochrome c oxidase assembly protein n=1 Tax=Devosia sp. YR412 TaxID=1881030 RepID=UPI001FCDB91F|nr:cytochrome c oxidase assembly protein [Devosia sp. YR412]
MFSAAMATLVLIFISPLCALTVALFSARVVHHVLLVAVAAPLLGSLLRRKKFGKMLAPLTGLQVAIFWLWHAPDAYQLALTSTPIYWLMQATLLGSATAMWAAIVNATPARAIGALLFLTMQMGLLGALLVFSQPLYAPHFSATITFGFTPESDQQFAGLIMWVPASLPYLAIGLWLLLTLLRQPEGRSA